MDRCDANRVIAIGFGLTALAVFLIGQVFMVVAAAALVSMAALLVKPAADRNRPAAGGPALRAQVDLH